jgi:hypothetical protein
LASNTTLSTAQYRPAQNFYIGAVNGSQSYSGLNYDNKEYSLISIGNGLTDTESTAFYTAVQKFQTTLGRQIGTPVLESGQTAGLLDTYSGAVAAYSLRKLRNGYVGNAIRVRRSSDNAEQDISFKADGTLDTTSLLSFVGSNNQALYSEEFDNAYWTKTNTTITTNQTTAPDGTMTADLLSETTAENFHNLRNTTNLTFTSGTSWNMSVYVKKGPGVTAPDTFALAFNGGEILGINAPWVLFNISTGVVVTSGNVSNDANFGSSITDVGNGWFRCAMWGTVTTTQGRPSIGAVRFTNNSNTINNTYYIGKITSNMYVWGYQFSSALNDTSVLTTKPYTKTTTTASGNGFVATWYDQSGNGNNATNSTAANQPQIVSSGSVINMSNKPSVRFTTSNMPFTQITGVSGLDIFVVSNFTDVTGGGQNWNIMSPILAETSGNAQDFVLGAKSSKISIWVENNGSLFLQTTATISVNTPYIYNGYGSSTTTGVGFNGSNYVTGASRRNDLIVRALGKDSTSMQFNGNLSEVVVYTSLQTDNRTGINTNINSYYSIY